MILSSTNESSQHSHNILDRIGIENNNKNRDKNLKIDFFIKKIALKSPTVLSDNSI